jgi:hypothetical protein
VGLSGARGRWLENALLDRTPLGRHQPSTQSVAGGDVEMGSGPWLVRGEYVYAAFDLPMVATGSSARLSARSVFVESRYRLHPRWQLAARVDRLDFGTIVGTALTAEPTSWDAPVTRLEGVLGMRVTRALEVRVGWQQNWRDGGRVRRRGLPAVSLLYWF